MQADQRTGKVHFAARAQLGNLLWLVRQDQRFKPAPGIGHAEVLKMVQIVGNLLIGQPCFQHKRE
ncbi:hypothetical protein D3C75_993000 [compost metagenome]